MPRQRELNIRIRNTARRNLVVAYINNKINQATNQPNPSQGPVQTDVFNVVGQKLPTLLDMLLVASVYTPCCMLLGVVAQILKLVKFLSQQPPTFLLFRDRRSVAQQCWISLHSSFNIVGAMHAHSTWSPSSYKFLPDVSSPRCIAGPKIVGGCCICLHV